MIEDGRTQKLLSLKKENENTTFTYLNLIR